MWRSFLVGRLFLFFFPFGNLVFGWRFLFGFLFGCVGWGISVFGPG